MQKINLYQVLELNSMLFSSEVSVDDSSWTGSII